MCKVLAKIVPVQQNTSILFPVANQFEPWRNHRHTRISFKALNELLYIEGIIDFIRIKKTNSYYHDYNFHLDFTYQIRPTVRIITPPKNTKTPVYHSPTRWSQIFDILQDFWLCECRNTCLFYRVEFLCGLLGGAYVELL